MNFIKDLATYTNKAYINIRDKISGITKNNKENSNSVLTVFINDNKISDIKVMNGSTLLDTAKVYLLN